MGVQDKLCIRKVVDTGYSREERERRQDGGARKSGVTHATGYTCRKNMREHRGRKSKSRQRRGREIVLGKVEGYRVPMHATCRE